MKLQSKNSMKLKILGIYFNENLQYANQLN